MYNQSIDKFGSILFSKCKNCKIYILAKMLKCTLIDCAQCTVEVKEKCIGPFEIFACNDLIIDIYQNLPICTIERCQRITINQQVAEMIYNVQSCTESNIYSRGIIFSIEDLFSKRRFYHVFGGSVECAS